jgi:hypothetical protein
MEQERSLRELVMVGGWAGNPALTRHLRGGSKLVTDQDQPMSRFGLWWWDAQVSPSYLEYLSASGFGQG